MNTPPSERILAVYIPHGHSRSHNFVERQSGSAPVIVFVANSLDILYACFYCYAALVSILGTFYSEEGRKFSFTRNYYFYLHAVFSQSS